MSRGDALAADDDHRRVARHHAHCRLALRSRHAARGSALDPGDPTRKSRPRARLLHRCAQHGGGLAGRARRLARRGGARGAHPLGRLGSGGERAVPADLPSPIPLVRGGCDPRRMVVPGAASADAQPGSHGPSASLDSAACVRRRPRPLASAEAGACGHHVGGRRRLRLSRRIGRQRRHRRCGIDLDDDGGPHDPPPGPRRGTGARARRDHRDASRSRPLLRGRRSPAHAAGWRTPRRRALSRRRGGPSRGPGSNAARDGGSVSRADPNGGRRRGTTLRQRAMALASSAARLRARARQRHIARHSHRGGERPCNLSDALPGGHRGVRSGGARALAHPGPGGR